MTRTGFLATAVESNSMWEGTTWNSLRRWREKGIKSKTESPWMRDLKRSFRHKLAVVVHTYFYVVVLTKVDGSKHPTTPRSEVSIDKRPSARGG